MCHSQSQPELSDSLTSVSHQYLVAYQHVYIISQMMYTAIVTQSSYLCILVPKH